MFSEKSLGHYDKTRNDILGLDNISSKLSPWIANGSISVRYVYWMAKVFEDENGKSQAIDRFIDVLLWRDFSHFWCLRHEDKMFQKYGIFNDTSVPWKTDLDKIQKWIDGQTGFPIIDALMR